MYYRMAEHSLDWNNTCKIKGGATILKVGGTNSRAERAKKIFGPPTFGLPGGDIKYCFYYWNYDV